MAEGDWKSMMSNAAVPISPNWMKELVANAALMPSQPFAACSLIPHAMVCTTASMMTIRPPHRWKRLKVSNDGPNREMSGLFLPAKTITITALITLK